MEVLLADATLEESNSSDASSVASSSALESRLWEPAEEDPEEEQRTYDEELSDVSEVSSDNSGS